MRGPHGSTASGLPLDHCAKAIVAESALLLDECTDFADWGKGYVTRRSEPPGLAVCQREWGSDLLMPESAL